MRFLCTHGYFYSECETCSEIEESIETIYWDEEFDYQDQRSEDYWLDLDEKSFRETQ